MFNKLFSGAAFVILAMLVSANAFAIEAVWIGGPAGTWSEPTNWSTGAMPNVATTHVTLDDNALQDTVAILNQNATVGNLTIDSGDALNFDPSRTLTASNVTLAGDVDLAASSQLRVRDLVWVQPGGVISLVDTSQVVGIESPFFTLWNEGRIEGAGSVSSTGISSALNNEGSIVANVPGKQLRVGLFGTSSRGLHNNLGELIAENGATLSISGFGDPPSTFFTPLENANGTIEARGDSTISMQKIRLVGGTLSTSTAGGTNEGLISLGSVMFENVTLEGNLALASVTYADRVTNNTDIRVQGFYVEGYATITGYGSMDLNGGSINVPGQGFGGYLVGTPGFVNDVNHTIKGPGFVNSPSAVDPTQRLSFDNRGIIETDDGVLQFNLRQAGSSFTNSQSSFNSGTIRAKTGGRIEILGTSTSSQFSDVLTNFSNTTPGLVEAAPDSTVVLGNMRLRGGTLRAATPVEGSPALPGKVISQSTTSPTAALENIRLEGVIGEANSKWALFGEIENTQALVGQLSILGPTTLTGGGEIQLLTQFGGIGAYITNDPFYDPLINEDNLIRGVGGIGNGLAFVNRGVVQADVPNGALGIAPSSQSQPSQYPSAHWNSGLLQAINGGELNITANIVNHEGTDLGTIHAGDGSEVRVAGVDGGLLTTEGSGKITAGGSSFGSNVLSNVHNQGSLHLSLSVGFAGRFVNDGTVVHAGTAYFNGGFIELTGDGTWGTANPSHSLAFNVFNSLVINDLQHTIQGGGTIDINDSTFINRGTLVANGTNPLVLDIDSTGIVRQEGTITVPLSRNFHVNTLDSQFTNEGSIEIAGEMRLLRVSLGGPLEFVNASGGVINLSGDIVMTAPVHASLRNEAGALFKGEGSIDLRLYSSNVPAAFYNEGTVRPESSASHIGSLLLNSDFEQTSSGVFEIDLDGTDAGEYDKLLLDDSVATLGGALDITLLGNFDPAVGDLFTILDTQGGTVEGVFDSVELPALAGRWWSLDYQADKVVLGVYAITADFDGNGFVDGDDLDDWQLASQGGTAAGDADGDGDSDGRDFLAWQRQFGAGIDPLATGVAVPEPNAFVLLTLCVAYLSHRRVR